MQVMLTFDYELFFGTQTGSVKACMIDPTNHLLDLAEQFKVPMTFFVDAGFLLLLEESKAKFPELETDYFAICEQMRRMNQLGCEIQLHIHPHWERSFYNGSSWVVNTDGAYKLADFPTEEIEQIIVKYHTCLQRYSDSKITAFRAGGWCIQPFSLLEKSFQNLGIRFDSSVFPGGKFESQHYSFDFSKVERFSSSYSFQSDVVKKEKNGFFTEIPIASWNYSPLFYWRLYILGRLFPDQHKMVGDGSFLAQPGRKKSVLTSFTWNHVSSDGYYASKLKKQASFYKKKGVDCFVVIGHPKGMTRFSLKKLKQFISAARTNYSFTSFTDRV